MMSVMCNRWIDEAKGWRCDLEEGHDGPCIAKRDEESRDALIEELARSLADSRGSTVVQHFHRSDARAILPIIARREVEARNMAMDEKANG